MNDNTTQHNTTQHNTTQHNTTQHKCLCQQCQNNEFKVEDFLVTEEDFKVLDKERPFGISGHMRVKNEAMSIAESIDSCIDFLDELIITYNTSTDGTEEILKEYQNKYSDKIRLYHYKPNIIKGNIIDYNNNKYSYVHSLANYYNYGYVKTKYKYYMKIDADQIYFTDKFLEIREALFANIDFNDLNKINIMNKILWWIPLRKLRHSLREKFQIGIKKKYLKNHYNNLKDINDIYDYVINIRISNHIHINNILLTFGGININIYNNDLYLYNRSIFNGCVGDHFIFIPNSSIYYTMTFPGMYEVIVIPYYNHFIGFCWVHLAYMKRNIKLKLLDEDILYNIRDLCSLDYKNISHLLDSTYNCYYTTEYGVSAVDENIVNALKNCGHFFDIDKKYITKYFCDKFLKKPLEYAIKYFNDKQLSS